MSDPVPQAAPAAPRFLNAAAMVKAVPLQFPLEYAGKVYSEIRLRKMTAGEVRAFIEDLNEARKADPNAVPRFPIFVDDTGAPVPVEVLDGLESDDFDAIDDAAVSFLPRRFVRGPTATTEAEAASTPSTGDSIEPTSSE